MVRRQIVVEAPIEQAFAVFTGRFGDFKPPEHNMLGVPIAETVFEPKVGGHIYDRGVDGSECRWARVLAFEPPRSGGVQLGHQSTAGRSRPSRTTPARSRSGSSPKVHSAPGSSWSTATSTGTAPAGRRCSDGVADDEGWPLYLDRYAALLKEGS